MTGEELYEVEALFTAKLAAGLYCDCEAEEDTDHQPECAVDLGWQAAVDEVMARRRRRNGDPVVEAIQTACVILGFLAFGLAIQVLAL